MSAGLILLKPARTVRQHEDEWKIGIDFGTTNTTAYYTPRGSNQPLKMEFDSTLMTRVTALGATRSWLVNYFLPEEIEEMPCQTLFHDFQIAPVHDMPFLDGHIYFPEHWRLLEGKGSLCTNLKWGSKKERERTYAFLQQFALQCAAHVASRGATRISWRFSYPAAFSKEDYSTFINLWRLVCDNVAQLSGLSLVEDVPKRRTESEAAASYFAHLDDIQIAANLNQGIVCLDIGGGSTDISVWQGFELLFQTSIQFAGQEILLKPLFRRPAFLESLNVPGVAASDFQDAVTRGDRKAFYTQVETLLRKDGDKLIRTLTFVDTAETRALRQLVAIGVAGILDYVGLVLLHLSEVQRFEKTLPNVYIGGNGAKLLDWIVGQPFQSDLPFASLIKRVLLDATGFRAGDGHSFLVHVSDHPKAEVAFGLVQDDVPLVSKEALQTNQFIAGECFSESGRPQEWDQWLSPARLHHELEITTDLKNLAKFLNVFKDATKSARLPKMEQQDLRILNDVRHRLNANLKALAHTPLDGIRPRPLFIWALQIFLDYRISDWAKLADKAKSSTT